jgi:hypothetical protein
MAEDDKPAFRLLAVTDSLQAVQEERRAGPSCKLNQDSSGEPMRLLHYLLLPVLLAFVWPGLAVGEDKRLTAVEPPLTQSMVTLYQDTWHWHCDLSLTAEQRRQHTRYSINFWQKKTPTERK